MAIINLNTLINALANGAQSLQIYKVGLPVSAAEQFFSMWTAGTVPAPAAFPTTAAICTKETIGAMPFGSPLGGQHSHIALLDVTTSVSGNDIQFHDRLAHMGGLNNNITTSQTVNLDISGAGNNLVNRRGASDYSDVQWWLEWYAQSGSTPNFATVTYTNAAGTSGRTTTVGSLGNTVRQGRMAPIIGSGGESIRSIQSVQLSVASGVVGNFGVTATRSLFGASPPIANAGRTLDFQRLGLPRIHDDAALFAVIITGSTSTGSVYATAKMIQG